MRVRFIGNGSDISRTTESAVSIGCSAKNNAIVREALGKIPSSETIFSWRRIRDEGPKQKFEQLFALAPDSTADLFEVFQCLRSQIGAYICRKGDKPKLRLFLEDPAIIDVLHFDSNYTELLAWRYRISCCLGIDPVNQKLKVVNRPAEDGYGSLSAACVKYHPSCETAVLAGASTGILKNKGPEHFQNFVRACVNDTAVLTPGISDISQSCRIVRRAIRHAVDELLNDAFIKEHERMLRNT